MEHSKEQIQALARHFMLLREIEEADEARAARKEHPEWFDGKEKVHTTIGVYPNGDYNVNGVLSSHLESHIEYNKTNRWGRALIVDGEVVYQGNCSKEVTDHVLALNIKRDACTAPYR